MTGPLTAVRLICMAAGRLPALHGLPKGAPVPLVQRYAYRSFDRRYALLDNRLGDYLRPDLLRSHGPKQLFITSLLSEVLGDGSSAVISALPPDLFYFAFNSELIIQSQPVIE